MLLATRNTQLQQSEFDSYIEFSGLKVRVSRKAKYLQLKVLYDGQVELVIPHKHTRAQALAFVKQNKEWLEQKRANYQNLLHQNPERFVKLPSTIELKASQEKWQVSYCRSDKLSVKEQAGQLHSVGRLIVAFAYEEQKQELIRNWLIKKSKRFLIPWFDSVSHRIGLSYNKLSIRGQKTRWGSCTSEKNISLNRSLMFLPPNLVEYVFIHELCHTRYLNHSNKFWLLVEKFDPNYETHDKQLNHMNVKIPLWAL